MIWEQFVGFDVSQSKTTICVVDGVGKVSVPPHQRQWQELYGDALRMQ